jgi:undecaprenyl-diphosphatase
VSLSRRRALALGLLHGPTELLPVSSAGHTTLVPLLAGWPYPPLEGNSRKAFEVALHAGTAVALLARPPQGIGLGRERPGARELAFTAGAALPPALAGYALGETIERRLGTPASIAAGLLGGSAAILYTELKARRRESRPAGRGSPRAAGDAGVRDGVLVGLAQALALVPGVSRSGAAYAAARLRGFGKIDADRLSWRAGLPVIGGATLLQTLRLWRRGAPAGTSSLLATGAAGAFASTLLAGRILGPQQRTAAMLPACLYRVVLAWTALSR